MKPRPHLMLLSLWLTLFPLPAGHRYEDVFLFILLVLLSLSSCLRAAAVRTRPHPMLLSL